MATNGSQGDRSISTGGLMIDGTHVQSIELNHETCSYRVFGNGEHAIDTIDFRDRLPLFATDKGLILRQMRTALSEGRRVTAHTEEFGMSEFSKIGPIVFGRTEQHVIMSVGRFGLSSVLGLKQENKPSSSDPSDGHNFSITGPFHPL